MSSRQATSESGGVQLFPFLAVLLCTMGSLLVLLVVFGERAKNSALAEKAARTSAASDKPPADLTDDDARTAEAVAAQLAELQANLPNLEKLRADAAERLRDEQARIAHLEDHERRLEHELAKLHVALSRLKEAEERQNVDQESAEQELERLQSLVADAEEEIDAIRSEAVGKKSYAIVPYKGSSGTFRRPIYIECTREAITIQPEGIKLKALDFDGPLRSGNPLAAALRAAREELKARAAAAGTSSAADEADPYPLLIVRPDGAYAYSAALSAISSWDADFGYEFVDADWQLEYPAPDPRLSQVMFHAVEQARERQALLAKAAPRRYGARFALGSGQGGGGGDGNGGNGFDGIAMTGGSGDRIGDHGGENWIDDAHSCGGVASDGAANSAVAGQAGSGQTAGQFTATNSTNGGLNGNGANSTAMAGVNGADMTPGMEAAGQAGGQITDAAGNRSAEVGMAAATSGGGSSSSMEDALAANEAAATGASSSASGTTGGSNSMSGSASGGGTSGGNAAASAAAAGGASLGSVQYSAGQTASAAASRGVNWANPAASRRASAINRPIRVVIRPEQIDVMPDRDGGSAADDAPTTISFHQPTDRVLDQLAASVQQQVKDWGLAGNGMYWRPTLVLEVAPGADQHAIRLNDLLRDSGIDVRFQEVASRTDREVRYGSQ